MPCKTGQVYVIMIKIIEFSMSLNLWIKERASFIYGFSCGLHKKSREQVLLFHMIGFILKFDILSRKIDKGMKQIEKVEKI